MKIRKILIISFTSTLIFLVLSFLFDLFLNTIGGSIEETTNWFYYLKSGVQTLIIFFIIFLYIYRKKKGTSTIH